MLRGLSIRDIVLIDAARLAFHPGLNVLTGETGAGKSILLDALGFVLGARGRAELLRAGAATGEVVAEFDLDPGHQAHAILDEAGVPVEDELILRREIDGQGRSRAFANDRRCGAELLRALGGVLVEQHGQQDDRGLLDPRGHRALLDAFGAIDAGPVRAAWRTLVAARAALAEATGAEARAAEDADFLRHAVKELTALAPRPGEEAALDTERRRMQAAIRIRDDVARAATALGGDGAEGAMWNAARWLADAADRAEGRLDAPIAALERALAELGEAVAGVEGALDALDVDPGALERAEERLFALRALARKHRVGPDDLPGLAATLAARLATIDGGEAARARLAGDAARAETTYADAARALTAARVVAAAALDTAVARELPPLKLDRARFATRIAAGEPGPDGADAVGFEVATNPGSPPGPLGRIASGGELSRFLLALKVCLAGRGGAMAMVFDEIDRGVGGATADAVGRRLAVLAQGGQVLAVTHSPQVAARGDHHWRIEKTVSGGQTRTRVVPLDPAAREDELARMLAGETVTQEARAAARSLLAQ